MTIRTRATYGWMKNEAHIRALRFWGNWQITNGGLGDLHNSWRPYRKIKEIERLGEIFPDVIVEVMRR